MYNGLLFTCSTSSNVIFISSPLAANELTTVSGNHTKPMPESAAGIKSNPLILLKLPCTFTRLLFGKKMKNTTLYNKNTVMILALLIIPLLGLGIDIYVPSLPALTQYFATSSLHVQNTLTIYLLGLGVSQLIAGNIVDAYGRRNTLLIALLGYIILCLFIVHTNSINVMVWFRFLQGICAGFAAVSARSIFSDLFSGAEYYRKASYMTIAYSIGPVIAPFIGGYLQHYLGWEANFYFLFVYAIIVFILALFLFPETIQKRHPISIKNLGVRYFAMFTHVEFMVGIICLSALYALLMLFNLVGPFIAQVKLHYSP